MKSKPSKLSTRCVGQPTSQKTLSASSSSSSSSSHLWRYRVVQKASREALGHGIYPPAPWSLRLPGDEYDSNFRSPKVFQSNLLEKRQRVRLRQMLFYCENLMICCIYAPTDPEHSVDFEANIKPIWKKQKLKLKQRQILIYLKEMMICCICEPEDPEHSVDFEVRIEPIWKRQRLKQMLF